MIARLVVLYLIGLGNCAKKPDRTQTSESGPTASTPLGKYQGTILKNSYDKPIFSFKRIRYAEPPVGELRFKPAVPVKEHEGVYNATYDPPACPQEQSKDTMSEDCLFLNVYTTKLPTENDKVKRPVLVFMHPGDNQKFSSTSNWAGPQYILNSDVVLVTFNYRLGVLGFISTGDKEAPGNLGLKDQVQVLKWVKQNIEGFGGDPNSVTIYGAASGSYAVNLHLVSPLTKGLFHKVIMSSGSAAGVPPVGRSLLRLTKTQAKIVGCPHNSTTSIMVECLKKKPAEELGKSIEQLNPFPAGFPVWKAVIEEDFGQDRFLTDHPGKLMLEGKFHNVPISLGYNSDQYSDLAIETAQDSEELKKFDETFEEYAPFFFAYNHDPRAKAISRDLKSFYFGDKKIDINTTLPQLMNLFNDGFIGYNMHRTARMLAAKNTKPVFGYLYTYRARLSHFHPKEGPLPKGPVLYDDLIYIFYISAMFPKIERDDPEFKLIERKNCKTENFMTTGDPSCPKNHVKWEPYNVVTQRYLEGGKKAVMKSRLHSKRYAEWEKWFPITKYDIVQDSSPYGEMYE